MSKNNLVEIVNRNQISSQHRLKFIDDEANTRSYIPNVIFSLDSIKAIYCDMDVLLKSTIKDYLEEPDFDPKSANIEVITENGTPKYVQYDYWLKLNGDDDDEIYPLSKSEYMDILYKLDFKSIYGMGAKYPTIEELKEYVKEKE